MSDKKIPLSLKVTTVTALPLIAAAVTGFFIRKSFHNLMEDLDLSEKTKGRAKNVSESYPTKTAIMRARQNAHYFSNQKQHVNG